jgi:hypothetical protein
MDARKLCNAEEPNSHGKILIRSIPPGKAAVAASSGRKRRIGTPIAFGIFRREPKTAWLVVRGRGGQSTMRFLFYINQISIAAAITTINPSSISVIRDIGKLNTVPKHAH